MSLIALVFAVLPAASPARAGEAIGYSGLIIAVHTTRETLTLDEIGPRHHGARDVHRVVALTPHTRCVLVSRAAGRAPDGWPDGFDRWPLAPVNLRAGDYAPLLIAPRGRGGHPLALSITVVRPEGPGATRPSRSPARGRETAEVHRVG